MSLATNRGLKHPFTHLSLLLLSNPIHCCTFHLYSELRPRLNEGKKIVEDLELLNEENEEGLTDILLGLNMIPTDGYGDRAEEAAVKAEDAKQRAEKAANTIEDILTKLPGDQKKIDEIPESIATANREIRNAQNQGIMQSY